MTLSTVCYPGQDGCARQSGLDAVIGVSLPESTEICLIEVILLLCQYLTLN